MKINQSILKFKHFALGLVVLGLNSCSTAPGTGALNPLSESLNLQSSASSIPLKISYELPNDLPASATDKEIANFAWNEFFALNWESSWTPQSQTRFQPNTSWNATQATPSIAVFPFPIPSRNTHILIRNFFYFSSPSVINS